MPLFVDFLVDLKTPNGHFEINWPLILLHIKYLKFLGDEIPKDDVAKLLDELCDKEDDDGMIPYVPFLERLCGKV